MHRRPSVPSLVLLASVLLLPSCGTRVGGVRYPAAGEGRIVVEQRGGSRLLDGAAEATYCRQDSVLVVLAVGGRWSAGLTVRGAFPVGKARTFTVRPALAGDGTAAAAFRSVDDSVHRAVMALRGTVRLDPGPRASGRFEIAAAPAPGRSDPIHFVGAFRALPTTDTTITCGALPRIP